MATKKAAKAPKAKPNGTVLSETLSVFTIGPVAGVVDVDCGTVDVDGALGLVVEVGVADVRAVVADGEQVDAEVLGGLAHVLDQVEQLLASSDGVEHPLDVLLRPRRGERLGELLTRVTQEQGGEALEFEDL